MISQKSSTKTDSRFSLSGAGRFLICKARSNWASFLLYSCLALIIPIFVLAGMGYTVGIERGKLLLGMLQDESAQILFTCAAVAAALLSSVYAWRNTHTKAGNYFEHKLPLTRNALFLSNSLFGLLLFAVPFLIMMLIFTVIGACNCGSLYASFMAELLKITVYTLAFYILYYSVFTFSAVVCGNTAVHVAFSLIVLFIPYTLSFCLRNIFEMTFGWRIAKSTLLDILNTSPISLYTRFGSLVDMSIGKVFLGSLYVLIGATVIITIASVLNIFLKSERAGNAFTYNGIRVTVKYIIIFIIMTLVACLLADNSARNAGGIIISCLLLALIGFACNIVLNMIMYRGVRRGALKGIRAFACVALVCLIIMSAMILRSGKAPVELSSGFCREVIMFDNENEYGKRRVYLITDKDDIRRLMEIASNRKYTDLNIGYEESYTPVDTKDIDNATYGYLSNSFHAAIIVNTVFGSTLRNYFNYDFISEDDARFIEKLKNKTTVEDALISLSKSCEVYACSAGFVSGTFRNSGLDDILRDVYLPELKEMYGLDYVDFSMKSAYSAFCIDGYGNSITLPIYSDMAKTQAAIKKLYNGKEFPDAPAFSAEEIVENQCREIMITCDIYGVARTPGGDYHSDQDYFKSIGRNLSVNVPSEKLSMMALIDYIIENPDAKKHNSSLIYATEEDEKEGKDPIARVDINAYIKLETHPSRERLRSVFVPFNRETAKILDIDYDGLVAEILAFIAENENTESAD